MLDIKFIRNNPDIVKLAAKNKNVAVDVDKLLALDERRRHLQGELDQVNSFRNALARASESGKPSPDQIAEGKKYKETLGAFAAPFLYLLLGARFCFSRFVAAQECAKVF